MLFGTQWGARIFDLDTKQQVLAMQGSNFAAGTAMSADGRLVLTANPDTSASADLSAHLLDAVTGQEIRRLTGLTAHASTAAISPNGRFGLTGSADGKVRLWDLSTGKQLPCLAGFSVAFLADGRYAVTGDSDLRLWRIPSGEMVASHSVPSRCICPLPDNRFVLCGHGIQNGEIRLWRLPLNKSGRVFVGKSEIEAGDPIAKQKHPSEPGK